MTSKLQLSLLIVSVLSLIYVIYTVIKNKMNIHYSVVWIIWSICMIVISIFPEIVSAIGKMLGIAATVNTVYLLLIFLLYCMTFYLFLKISKHNEEIIKLNYEISVLKQYKSNEIKRKSNI